MKTTSNNYLKHSSDESRSGTCDQQHLFAYKTVLHENSNDNDKKTEKLRIKCYALSLCRHILVQILQMHTENYLYFYHSCTLVQNIQVTSQAICPNELVFNLSFIHISTYPNIQSSVQEYFMQSSILTSVIFFKNL